MILPGSGGCIWKAPEHMNLCPQLSPCNGPEKMSESFVLYIIVGGIAGINKLHASAEIGKRCLNQEMIVITHKAVGMNQYSKSMVCIAEIMQESFLVFIGVVYLSTLVAARGDVIESARVFYP